MNKRHITVLDGIRDAYKPKLFVPILVTMVALGPYGNLWLDAVSEKYDRLILLISLSGITLVSIGVVWALYITALMRYFDEKNDYLGASLNRVGSRD